MWEISETRILPIALQFEMPVDLLSVIAALMGSSVVLIFGLIIVLGIIWLFVPFAIFGIKPRPDRLTAAVSELAQSQKAVSEDLCRVEQKLRAAEDREAAESRTSTLS